MFFGNFRHLTGPRSFSGIHGISEGVAKRKNPTATVRRPTKIERVVVTLDPNKLAEKKQQSLFISNQESFKPRVALAKEFIRSPRLVYDWTRQADQQTHWPYPPDTRAFLYYTTIPGKPRIAGELRLRLASSDDPASFTGGSDLLRINGQPWSRPLYFLNKFYTALYQKMREERLVPDDLDAVLSTFPTRRFIYSRSQILYTLDDTFVIDFSGAAFLSIITEQGVETMPFIRVFKDSRSTCGYNPYTGSALARFERSTIPDHKGTRTIVMRFVKIITPVRCVIPLYDGHIVSPKEGELYRRTPPHSRIPRIPEVWSYDIDKRKGSLLRGFQLLWDAS